MGYFVKAEVDCQILSSGKIKLNEDLEYITSTDERIWAPKTFISDGASIPKFAWSLMGSPKSKKNLRPGIMHDCSYHFMTHTRKKCDDLFYEMLRSDGNSWWKAKVKYRIVRMFGGSSYG